MTDKDFQQEVLKELKEMKWEIWEVKSDVKSLHNKFDKLDDRVDDVESNIRQEIRIQGAYLNQAFDRMNYYQQAKSDFAAK